MFPEQTPLMVERRVDPQTLTGPPVQTLIEKLYIGLDQTPHSFNVREKVLGAAGANLQYINKETGVQISLRGIGSLYIEPNSNTESQEPLHLLLEHQRYENLNSALQLAKNLIETLHQEFRQLQETLGTQILSSPHIPTAQLNVPPLNVISSVPPPSVTAPLMQHQQISLVQQQLVPQNGLQMQLGQNAMIIQQQQPNFNMPPPSPQSSLLPMKPTNQIQLQFHQPPPGMSTHHTPFILNTQPQGLQYQYFQQTTTRDMQGNQQITFQPIIQQAPIPMQSQQQYFTVQQGNTTYMVPQSSFIQQAPFGTHPSAQYSIIHQQASSLQHAPHLQVQLPPMNTLPTIPNTQTAPLRHESKTDAHNDALPSSSCSIGLHDAGASVSVSHEDIVAEQVDGGTDQLNKLVVRNSPRGMPITSVPPPPINTSVPPPAQHFAGNHILPGAPAMANAMLPQQEMIPATPNGQPNSMGNSNSWQQARGPPPPLGQPLTDVQHLQSIGQQQPFAMTFAQQPLLQQPAQQFIHLQQPQQHQTQFGVIQTSPLNSANAFQQQQILQLQQIQPQNTLQVQQQQIHFSQQQLMQQQEKQQQIYYQLQQEQQEMGERAQIPMNSTSPAASNSRLGQKRRPTNESGVSSAGGPPPNQKIRAGVGSQSKMTNIAMTSASASTGNASNMVEAGGVCGQASSTNSSHNQQLLKPTHIGVMRYNQEPHKPVFDVAYPPPRGRTPNYNSAASSVPFNARPAQQQTSKHHLQQQQQQLKRMQIIHTTQPPPPLPAANVYSSASAPR